MPSSSVLSHLGSDMLSKVVSHSSHWFPDLTVLVGWARLYRVVSPALLGGLSTE